MVDAYRRAVGRRLGLDPVELLCIDLLRARGTVTASLIAERTGLTRGGVTKLIRRLELAGHLERRPEPDRQELMVALRAHPERDASSTGCAAGSVTGSSMSFPPRVVTAWNAASSSPGR